MRYLALLVYDPDNAELEKGTPEFDADLARYERFGELAGEAIVGGAALENPPTAVTIRPGDGEPLVTAGPFAETAEVVGGFYVTEAASLDDAIELFRHNPAAEDGAVELRPMVEWFDRGDEGPGRWLAMIFAKETEAEIPGAAGWDEGAAEHARFAEEAGDALVSGGVLHPSATATTVRVRDGEVLLTDGPYAETAEVLGGLYSFAASSRDEAVAIAAKIPVGPGGTVEVRPIMVFD